MHDAAKRLRLPTSRSLTRTQERSRKLPGVELKATRRGVQIAIVNPGKSSCGPILAQTRNRSGLTGPHSYYQPYYKDVHEVKDVIRLFAGYQRDRNRIEMTTTRERARRRTIYDVMEKDVERTLTRTTTYRGHELVKEGRKVETLLRRDAYDQSKRNLSTLSHILSRLRFLHQRSLALNPS